MNILFFLIPKSKVEYLINDYTIRQALEKMEYHRYTAIPMIDKQGHYIGTVTEGDLLWHLKKVDNLNYEQAETTNIMKVQRNRDNEPVYVNEDIENLLSKALNQNFIPVLDDNGIFIGIITRKDIIQYCLTEKPITKDTKVEI